MFCTSLLLLLLSLVASGSVKTIEIRSQQDFDGLGKAIQQALDERVPTVEVTFRTGTYYFSENHIDLEAPDAPNTTVILNGNGSILLGKGDDYILRLRDDCLIFDPMKQLTLFSDGEPARHIGLRMTLQMAKEANYTCILKLNNLVPKH